MLLLLIIGETSEGMEICSKQPKGGQWGWVVYGQCMIEEYGKRKIAFKGWVNISYRDVELNAVLCNATRCGTSFFSGLLLA